MAIRTVGEEEEIARVQCQQIPARSATGARLLPSVARKRNTVKSEHALHES
jgi:hypothetical protein